MTVLKNASTHPQKSAPEVQKPRLYQSLRQDKFSTLHLAAFAKTK